ncbi:argininosuccinate synthase [Candidatus Daviesbacteria bacterium RIFCSPHIGHO2_02_FULL_39_12]|uniref:argininosuccinate synthase n=2 Tax=Candidatus Daviesiibacteriota TaxID=1752718 RepID=A0A1F5JCP6_9BACT|nr:MAG: argininosuccinate synthase [Candidatus Daviesbacteria bacterium RIFCSPHIGHO2_02_FULL_39_12]OGE72886.1 MAG: argininosuccinate synthase [Candidatus Daviesbacteria bacterium RIFCSPLOWO2_02_FULL_38_15]
MVVLAFSGGLDTSFCVIYLKEQGYQVVTVTVDTGGFSDQESSQIAKNARLLGAIGHYFADGKQQLYDQFISYIIKGNILRGGVYPLCAGTERFVIASKLVEIAKKVGAKYIAHGSTGAGNDQIRFDIALKILAPELTALTPIRDLGVKREEEIELLKKYNFPIPSSSNTYSINQGMLGVTIGGKETKGSWEIPPEDVYPGMTPLEKTPDLPTTLIISFYKGLPVAIDSKKMTGIDIFNHLAKIGGKHGVGKNIHLGDTILGIKGRIVFAAPAALILIKAHKELEKLVQTKWQSFWKEILSDFYGNLLHEGLYFDPVMQDITAMINSSQENVTGDVRIKLFKGNIIIEGCKSPYSLMDTETAVYGEENLMWDARDLTGFSKIYSLQSTIAASVKRKNKNL